MSTSGYFLTTKIKIANEIGIRNAAIFPDISPGDKELPTIMIMPAIAKMIEAKVILDIFSLKINNQIQQEISFVSEL